MELLKRRPLNFKNVNLNKYKSNDIPTAIPLFEGQATRIDILDYCLTYGCVGNQIWRLFAGSRCGITTDGSVSILYCSLL